MYRGFNLKLAFSNDDITLYSKYVAALYQKQKSQIRADLINYMLADGALDAEKIQASWFPQISAPVFISHSHQDERTALAFAGWLKHNLNLDSFIDSAVWGNAIDLLKQIDTKYCMDDEKINYIYSKRNRSTSHVHMMLSVSLLKMIDRCECLFFLNTPASISAKGVAGNSESTGSPWIYSEIAMSQLIQRRPKEKHREPGLKSLTKAASEELAVQYKLNLNHLNSLSVRDLNGWFARCQTNFMRPRAHLLDILYELSPPQNLAD